MDAEGKYGDALLQKAWDAKLVYLSALIYLGSQLLCARAPLPEGPRGFGFWCLYGCPLGYLFSNELYIDSIGGGIFSLLRLGSLRWF